MDHRGRGRRGRPPRCVLSSRRSASFRSVGTDSAGRPRPSIAAAFVDRFWPERLIPGAAKAVDAAELVAAIEADRDAARRKYGRKVGLGGSYIYFVKGTGRVVSVDADAVGLALGGDRSKAQISLQAGFIFGNAVRDGTGLLDVSDFPNSQDFNAVSSELNRRVEERVLPELRKRAAVGQPLRFVGCAEIVGRGFGPPSPTGRARSSWRQP